MNESTKTQADIYEEQHKTLVYTTDNEAVNHVHDQDTIV